MKLPTSDSLRAGPPLFSAYVVTRPSLHCDFHNNLLAYILLSCLTERPLREGTTFIHLYS